MKELTKLVNKIMKKLYKSFIASRYVCASVRSCVCVRACMRKCVCVNILEKEFKATLGSWMFCMSLFLLGLGDRLKYLIRA